MVEKKKVKYEYTEKGVRKTPNEQGSSPPKKNLQTLLCPDGRYIFLELMIYKADQTQMS